MTLLDVVGSNILLFNATGGVDVAGSAGEVGKVAIQGGFHLLPEGSDDVGGHVGVGSVACTMGMRLVIGENNILLILPMEADQLQLVVCHSFVAGDGRSLEVAEIVAGVGAVLQLITADKVKIFSFGRSDIHPSGGFVSHSVGGCLNHPILQGFNVTGNGRFGSVLQVRGRVVVGGRDQNGIKGDAGLLADLLPCRIDGGGVAVVQIQSKQQHSVFTAVGERNAGGVERILDVS